MSIISNLIEKEEEKSIGENREKEHHKDVEMKDNLYNKVKKWMRLLLDKCPYCGKELIEGEVIPKEGGDLLFGFDKVKMCSDLHYIKRYDPDLDQLFQEVYENNGKVVDLNNIDWKIK